MASSGRSTDNHPLESTQGPVRENTVEMDNLKTSAEGPAEPQAHDYPDTAVAALSLDENLQSTVSAEEAEVVPYQAAEPMSTPDIINDALAIDTPAMDTGASPESPKPDSTAIGPSPDTVLAVSAPAPDINTTNPVCIITLLLTSGARHPYKLDEKYLAKRNVDVPGVTPSGKKDPFSISVYTLKELILREWRDEWEAQPSSPSSIRLIYFGRLLDDKTPLKGTEMLVEMPTPCLY